MPGDILSNLVRLKTKQVKYAKQLQHLSSFRSHHKVARNAECWRHRPWGGFKERLELVHRDVV